MPQSGRAPARPRPVCPLPGMEATAPSLLCQMPRGSRGLGRGCDPKGPSPARRAACCTHKAQLRDSPATLLVREQIAPAQGQAEEGVGTLDDLPLEPSLRRAKLRPAGFGTVSLEFGFTPQGNCSSELHGWQTQAARVMKGASGGGGHNKHGSTASCSWGPASTQVKVGSPGTGLFRKIPTA